MSWSLSAGGHFGGANAVEEEKRLVEKLNEVIAEFKTEAEPNGVTTMSFFGQFVGQMYMDSGSGRLERPQ
jgi:hypothetical protein